MTSGSHQNNIQARKLKKNKIKVYYCSMLSFGRVIYSVQVSQTSISLYTHSARIARERIIYSSSVDIITLWHQVPILLLRFLKTPASWHGLLLGRIWCGWVLEPCCRTWCTGQLGQCQSDGCMGAHFRVMEHVQLTPEIIYHSRALPLESDCARVSDGSGDRCMT